MDTIHRYEMLPRVESQKGTTNEVEAKEFFVWPKPHPAYQTKKGCLYPTVLLTPIITEGIYAPWAWATVTREEPLTRKEP